MQYGGHCEECQLDLMAFKKCKCEKGAVYELLRTDKAFEPAQVFTRYHDKDITRIRSHVYGEKSKSTKGIIDYDENSVCSLYLFR